VTGERAGPVSARTAIVPSARSPPGASAGILTKDAWLTHTRAAAASVRFEYATPTIGPAWP
jgi:hypothetical protein